MNRIFWIMLITTSLKMSSCVTSIDEGVELNRRPNSDSAYSDTLKKSTRSANVQDNFETRYVVHATVLSPEFRSAFSERLKKVFLQDHGVFDEANSKVGFFVSIFSPQSESVELTNPLHWTIYLEQNGTRIKPVILKRLYDKVRWEAFFDYVTKWSHEYLLVFDSPSVNPGSAELVAPPSVRLILANKDARTSLSW